MTDSINALLIATPDDLKKWLESYHLSKYPDDEPGIWSTHGRISYHLPEHGAVTFEIRAPNPGELLIVSVEYKKNDQSKISVDSLINEILSRFGSSSSQSGSKLRDQLASFFNISELKNLCDDLDIEYENLSGETRDDIARELIRYCHRHGKFEELITNCKRLRPHVGWETSYPQKDTRLPNLVKLSPAEQYQIALHWAKDGRNESLYGFDLRGCVLWEVDLERADLRNADLRNTDLGRANLQKANLIGADLRGASLFDTYLHGAKIDQSTQIDAKFRLVLDIIEVGGKSRKRNLRGVDLSNTILVWGELSDADLREANLSGSTLTSAKLSGSDLTNANLAGVDLSKADLHSSKLMDAVLLNAILQEADLSNADLRGAKLSGAKLIWGDSAIDKQFPLNLSGAKYNEATIWPNGFDPKKWGAIYEA